MVAIGQDRISRSGFYGTRGLDVTVKSAGPVGKAFAPTWGMVMDFKQGRITWDEYRAAYIQSMRISYVRNREAWDKVLDMTEVYFLCYCANPLQCHRSILMEIFRKLGAKTI